MKHYVALFFVLVLLAAGCFGKDKNEGDQPVVIGGYAIDRTLNDFDYDHDLVITLAEDESKDLSGIEQLPEAQIKQLFLTLKLDAKKVDLTPLRHLQHLEYVSLSGEGLTMIPDFSSSPSILHLEIWDSNLASLDGIETMPSLTYLQIDSNGEHLSDISTLRHLKNLKYLFLYSSPMNLDFAVLKYLPALHELLAGGDVDLRGISQLKSLRILSLQASGGSIANVEEIGRMPWLKELSLNDSIASIEFLASNTNLEVLEIWVDSNREDYDGVSLPLDVSPLKNLTNLRYLALRGFDLQNAEGLDELPNLEYFNTDP